MVTDPTQPDPVVGTPTTQAPWQPPQQAPASPGPLVDGPTATELWARRFSDHWGILLAYGVLTVALGLILAVWPGETLVVLAVLVAIQLLISGAFRIGLALVATATDGGIRALMGISGALGLIVGLLCLRDPLQTLLVLGIILGAWWLISGVIDVMSAVLSSQPGRRGWDIAGGLVSIAVGGILLAHPDLSLGLLVLLACTWLFALGGLAVATALWLRSNQKRRVQSHHPASPAA